MSGAYVVPLGALNPLPPIPTTVELDLEADARVWDALIPDARGILMAIPEDDNAPPDGAQDNP